MKKTIKVLVSVLLTLCMLLPMATMVFATTPEVPKQVANSKYTGDTETIDAWKTYYSGLSTTQFDVYSADALVALVELINDDTNGFAGKTVSLKCDLIFNEGNAGDWADPEKAPSFRWTPIANFAGTFNGEGHTVSGLYINTSADTYSGFFGCLKDNAKVYNLGVVNSYMNNTKSTSYMGSIAGAISGKSVEIFGCYSDAILNAGYTGGIVGLVEQTVAKTDINKDPNISTAALVSQCAFNGEATANTASAGGIVATTDPTKTDADYDAVKIFDCVNFGTVSTTVGGSGKAMGGILGFIERDDAQKVDAGGIAVIERCLNFGAVNPPATGADTNTRANALVGQLRNTVGECKITITDCFIFTDLEQEYLFANKSIDGCNGCTYIINGVQNESSDLNGAKVEVPDTHITEILKDLNDSTHINYDPYIIADSNTVKNTLPFEDNSNWTTRTNNAKDEYPLPKAVYDNFFRVELKYIQSTDPYGENKNLYDVRIIAEIDSLNYTKAGFKIEGKVDEVRKAIDIDTTEGVAVYKTVKSKNSTESVTAVDGRYYITITVSQINGASTFTFTPYTVGIDGEYTYGVTMELVFDSQGVCSNVTKINKEEYRIIQSASNPNNSSACVNLASAFRTITGKAVEVYTDEVDEADESVIEILVGDTDRTQTTACKSNLGSANYSITEVDNKIVIVAANDLLLEDAVEYFISNMNRLSDGTYKYPTNYTSKTYQALDLVTSSTANYKIVYTDFYNNINLHSGNKNSETGIRANSYDVGFTQTQANSLASALNALTGATFDECIPESEMSDSQKEIIIGKPNGDTNLDFEYYENGVYLVGDDIYIYGHNHEGIVTAINNFLARVKKYNTYDNDKYSFYCDETGYKWENLSIKYNIPLPTDLNYEGAYTAANNGIYFVYENCSSDVFDAYCSQLSNAGFSRYFTRTADDNCFAGFHNGGESAWIYYIATRNEMRVVFEEYQSLPNFESDNAELKDPSKGAFVTQMGVSHTADNENEGKGMGYIIGLEDGRYIIIDGGIAQTDNGGSFTTEDKDKLATRYYNYLKDNNNREDEKIVIAAWIITHGHSDHYSNFEHFGKLYGSKVECQTIIHNLPTELTLWGAANASGLTYIRNHKSIDANFKDAKVYTVHTGYEATIGGVYLEFMSTYEDLYNNNALVIYDQDPCQRNAVDEMNDTSLTFRLVFNNFNGVENDEVGVFFLADNYYDHGERVASMWSADYMKTKVVQVAHHGWSNGVTLDGNSNCYSEIRAEYGFWSNYSKQMEKATTLRKLIYNNNDDEFTQARSYCNDYDGIAKNTTMTFNDGEIAVEQTEVATQTTVS